MSRKDEKNYLVVGCFLVVIFEPVIVVVVVVIIFIIITITITI